MPVRCMQPRQRFIINCNGRNHGAGPSIEGDAFCHPIDHTSFQRPRSRPSHCIRLRFRSSSPLGSSSSSGRSMVSLGFKIWAMLPLLVGGADESLRLRALSRLLAEFQDQPPKVSALLAPPLEKGGGGVVGREEDGTGCCACSENEDNDSRMRWSSGTRRPGDEGHGTGGVLDAGSGEVPGCHPCARMSAAVCRLPKLLNDGGVSTLARGCCGPDGGGAAALRSGDDC
jgi:hypothetical protein